MGTSWFLLGPDPYLAHTWPRPDPTLKEIMLPKIQLLLPTELADRAEDTYKRIVETTDPQALANISKDHELLLAAMAAAMVDISARPEEPTSSTTAAGSGTNLAEQSRARPDRSGQEPEEEQSALKTAVLKYEKGCKRCDYRRGSNAYWWIP